MWHWRLGNSECWASAGKLVVKIESKRTKADANLESYHMVHLWLFAFEKVQAAWRRRWTVSATSYSLELIEPAWSLNHAALAGWVFGEGWTMELFIAERYNLGIYTSDMSNQAVCVVMRCEDDQSTFMRDDSLTSSLVIDIGTTDSSSRTSGVSAFLNTICCSESRHGSPVLKGRIPFNNSWPWKRNLQTLNRQPYEVRTKWNAKKTSRVSWAGLLLVTGSRSLLKLWELCSRGDGRSLKGAETWYSAKEFESFVGLESGN